MKALMSSRPRRGSCNEYCKSMLGAASSSTIPRLHVSPQKSVNQRPTMALLALSLDMIDHFLFSDCGKRPPLLCEVKPDRQLALCERAANSGSCLGIEREQRAERATSDQDEPRWCSVKPRQASCGRFGSA